MTLYLSEREAATLVVALRAWQNELSYYSTEELRDYYPDLRGIEPLSVDEVERLLAQLEAGELPPERSKAAVSDVCVSAEGAGGES